jgi:YVTN family beta-propeller protein
MRDPLIVARLGVLPLALALLASPVPAADFVNFESQQVHPIALSADGSRLFAVNTPDNRLAVFTVSGAGIALDFEVQVGLEPVSVAVRDANTVWVVNHLSDTISIVNLTTRNVVASLPVGDEPTDVVFAGGATTRAFVCVSQEDAIKIYDPANLLAPPVVVPIFGSDPQALAVSPDGSKVYAAVFESGNQTTIADFQDVLAHGGLPAPNPPGRPNVGLILKWQNGNWLDEVGRNYNNSHPYTLPDHDVAVLDANAPVPSPTYFDHLGTLNYNLGVHPVSGQVYVANTDAQNQTRFEPSLRGKFIRTRMAIVNPAAPASPVVVDLNPHINYNVTPGPQFELDQSLSQPGGMAFAPAGGTIYLTALGSGKVAVLDDNATVIARIEVGEGPSGLALDQAGQRLYVLNRFDNEVAVVNTATRTVIAVEPLYDPSPSVVTDGRRFLYDARRSSGHGDQACASCHAGGGNLDAIAWDLGDPNGQSQPPPPGQIDPFLSGFHPMKGPMTTQTLRGLDTTQPFHWRGDRPDFEDFNPAFISLMGRSAELAAGDMQAFKDFIFTVTYAPNPNQNLDRTYPNPPTGPSPEDGRQAYMNVPLDGPFRCVDCHALPSGTNGQLVNAQALQSTQDFKIPQLRNLYEKTGLTPGAGQKKRGYGFVHDGGIGTLFDFLRLPVFSFGNNDPLRRDVEAFLLAFDTGTAPATGAQRTVNAITYQTPETVGWVDLMVGQDDGQNIDLVVKGRSAGIARGWVYAGGQNFRSDRSSEPLIGKTALLALANAAASELTFTGVPPGSGQRIGIDRDLDGFFDRTELDAGSNPADPGSTPENVGVGPVDVAAVARPRLLQSFPNPATAAGAAIGFETGQRERVRIRIFDPAGRFVATVYDGEAGPGKGSARWDGRNERGQVVASGQYFYRLESGGHEETRSLVLMR